MEDVEVVVVVVAEVARVFVRQKGGLLGAPLKTGAGVGKLKEPLSLMNLSGAIEARSFQRRQGGQSVKTSPASLGTHRLNAAF